MRKVEDTGNRIEDLLLNVKEGDIIKGLDDLPLHLINCCCVPCLLLKAKNIMCMVM